MGIMIFLKPLKSISVVAKAGLISLLIVGLAGCSTGETDKLTRIALLAPFEGRYREIGYDAFYAAHLAFQDSGRSDIELLAVDDGGSVDSAVERARALTRDPLVQAVIVLGYNASDEAVQVAFGDLSVIIVGNWQVESQSENILMLTDPNIRTLLSHNRRLDVTDAARVEAPFVGGDVFALRGFRNLRADLSGITVISSGRLPDEAFRNRIIDLFSFSVEPSILAADVYEAFRIAIEATQNKTPTITHFAYNSNRELIPNDPIK
jgi:hypothetical protein